MQLTRITSKINIKILVDTLFLGRTVFKKVPKKFPIETLRGFFITLKKLSSHLLLPGKVIRNVLFKFS